MKQLISIILPVYNAARFLPACLNSILAQTFVDWELIAIDDFSSDRSTEILAQYALMDERIQWHPNGSKGIIPALQLAFAKSKGAFITRMDADDLMPKGKLKTLFTAIKPGRVIATGKVQYFSDQAVSKGYRDYEHWLNELVDLKNHWEMIYRECVIASPNWLVARECFEKDIPLETLVYPEDYDMTLKWYQLGYTVESSADITHLWREHPERTSRIVADYQQEAFFNLKTNRFIDYELNEDEPLQLFGAGKKGKLVAAVLTKRNCPFQWLDVNAPSYNNGLLGKEILPLTKVKTGQKAILTAWPKNGQQQKAIRDFLREKQLFFGENCWLF